MKHVIINNCQLMSYSINYSFTFTFLYHYCIGFLRKRVGIGKQIKHNILLLVMPYGAYNMECSDNVVLSVCLTCRKISFKYYDCV